MQERLLSLIRVFNLSWKFSLEFLRTFCSFSASSGRNIIPFFADSTCSLSSTSSIINLLFSSNAFIPPEKFKRVELIKGVQWRHFWFNKRHDWPTKLRKKGSIKKSSFLDFAKIALLIFGSALQERVTCLSRVDFVLFFPLFNYLWTRFCQFFGSFQKQNFLLTKKLAYLIKVFVYKIHQYPNRLFSFAASPLNRPSFDVYQILSC